MVQALKFVVIVLAMLSIVPIVGTLTTGSFKQGLQYAKDWIKVIAWMLIAGSVLAIFLFVVIPNPL
jgi:hypothetical protein